MAKKGAILLKFSPAIPGQQQKYDWGKKQVCAPLSFLFMADESIFDWIDAHSSSLWLIVLMNSCLLIFLNMACCLCDIAVTLKFFWCLFSFFLASLLQFLIYWFPFNIAVVCFISYWSWKFNKPCSEWVLWIFPWPFNENKVV